MKSFPLIFPNEHPRINALSKSYYSIALSVSIRMQMIIGNV
ncbi:hypothetical protein HMPREF1121_01079 [Porphyromonas sp. KLE 1280]|nr:hypothetical protein HMPREF1121_01079 [Porphyromonas sp. KLE 1280]